MSIHRRSMCFGVAAVALAAGCQATHGAPEPIVRVGTFTFQARSSGGAFQGTFRVLGDTVIPEVSTGPCVYANSDQSSTINYRCGEVSLSFDRTNLARRPSYGWTHEVRTVSNTCVATRKDPKGNDVCVSYAPKETISRVTESGTLHPVKAAASTPGAP